MLSQAQTLQAQLVDWRREFHTHPELGFEEHRTAAYVAKILSGLGYKVWQGVGRTGVVAELGDGNPLVALRADMDALPIQEENDVVYASQVPGVMHACGHDAHTAICLGAAALLRQVPFKGKVRFLFQPSEESSDDQGLSGAQRMIEDGAMQGVAAVLALHLDASLPVGTITVDNGPCSAGVDTFYASVIGEGGHGALFHPVVDPIHLAGHVILALHGIVSRRVEPFAPAVISIGAVHGGQAHNVIPDRVELCGTIRYMEPATQVQLHAEIEKAMAVARALGGDYELRIEIGYPPTNNHPGVAELVRQVGVDMLGKTQVLLSRQDMGGEDFGFLARLAPGAMFLLGCRLEGDERKHHSARFDIDEGCLPFGAALLAETALRALQRTPF